MKNLFKGTWTYRSFLRDSDINTEFNDLKFGVGIIKIDDSDSGTISGTLGGSGWSLVLNGRYSLGNLAEIRFQGKGEINGEIWTYDYLGHLSPSWPNGIDETPAITGTIVRTTDHSAGKSPAGFVAAWIAIKQ